MEGEYNVKPRIVNEGSSIYRVGGMTVQTLSYVCPANQTVTLNFPEPFKQYVFACFAYNAQVGFSALQTISCGAANLSQCMVYQNNQMSAQCALQIVAMGY